MQQINQERRTKNRKERPRSIKANESGDEKRDYHVAHRIVLLVL